MDHADLISEMTQMEGKWTSEQRQHIARIRRAQQLKLAKQREKEWQKAQSRKANSTLVKSNRKHIFFEDSVVLLEAAARNDINEVARLLQKGVSPDATNNDGLTALHQACIDNNPDMLKLLLDYGANVDAVDSENWTPLHAAATCGHLFLIKILISRGANLLAVNSDGNMPYDICDNDEALDYIETEMSVRGITQELIDETRASTETKMLQDLQEIVEKGGSLDTVDAQGATPLHIAAANGYTRVVEFLLDQNVAMDVGDNDNWRPVHAAACWGQVEVLELLVQHGADLNMKNKNEETPADICEDPEVRDRINYLRTEQENKRLAEAQKKKVKRSQSNNTRVHSVRRTSLRDKGLTTKKDAVEEARLRQQVQDGFTTTDIGTNELNSITSETNSTTVDGCSISTMGTSTSTSPNNITLNNNNKNNLNSLNNNLIGNNSLNNNNNNTTNNGINYSNSTSKNPLYGQHNNTSPYPSQYDTTLSTNRRSPDGKDNDSSLIDDKSKLGVNNNSGTMKNGISSGDLSGGIFQASNDNGKINVQVTVLVDTQNIDTSIAGTLADLKKHRAQSRSSSSPENGSIVTTQSLQPIELSIVSSPDHNHTSGSNSQTATLSKFSGITGDVVSDSTRSRKCCVMM